MGFRKLQRPVAVGDRGSHTPGCKARGGGVPSGISNYGSYFCPADCVVLALGMRNEASHY